MKQRRTWVSRSRRIGRRNKFPPQYWVPEHGVDKFLSWLGRMERAEAEKQIWPTAPDYVTQRFQYRNRLLQDIVLPNGRSIPFEHKLNAEDANTKNFLRIIQPDDTTDETRVLMRVQDVLEAICDNLTDNEEDARRVFSDNDTVFDVLAWLGHSIIRERTRRHVGEERLRLATENLRNMKAGQEREARVLARKRCETDSLITKRQGASEPQQTDNAEIQNPCCICLDNAVDTAIVDCGHTFCKGCLSTNESFMRRRSRAGNDDLFSCPLCRVIYTARDKITVFI